jgi:hypothetical protein
MLVCNRKLPLLNFAKHELFEIFPLLFYTLVEQNLVSMGILIFVSKALLMDFYIF